ncbi:hypothetical protein ONE63_000449 [Megalurothrips usitatus]|uniref:F-box domain-containing protein n=1 Tax=Megalurothrips usitatus TaxID=439358 RepID=A0AAV7Y4J4_9NEOP|nr:hypothetical protein ONE63_000449 [Megalurothrips usitatus]
MSASESDDSREGSASDGDCDGALAATLPDLALLQVFEYVAADSLDDLVSAGQVCSHWRRVAASGELWRRRRLRSHGLATLAFTRVVAFAPRLLALDVCWINQISPEDRVIRKRALLESRCKLSRLTGVLCHRDADWAHGLLGLHAAHLRELEVGTADRDTLRAVGSMRRLRVLRLSGGDPRLGEDPYVFPDPDRSGTYDAGQGLEQLEVRGLPRDTTVSLLRAHRRTLRKLTLNVGTPGPADGAAGWPRTCPDLPQLLQDCKFKNLQELVLTRYAGCYHTVPECSQQRGVVVRILNLHLFQCSDCS